jgi:NTE family protein
MRAIAFVGRMIEDGKMCGTQMKAMRIHAIDAEDVMQGLGVASKLNADWEFLLHMHDIGRERAEGWLAGDFGGVGVRSTVDIREKYL